MADSPISAKVAGLAELKTALQGLSPKLRRQALRNALNAGARVLRDEAKRLAPILKLSTYAGGSAARRQVRKPGTLRNAIRVRTSKLARRAGDIGVFVNVRPAKGAARGAKSQNDPFYWRFVEFGTKKMTAKTFLRPAAAKLPDALRAFEKRIGPAVQKLNVKNSA